MFVLHYSTMQASELLGLRVYLLIILFTKAPVTITFKTPNENVTLANKEKTMTKSGSSTFRHVLYRF
jgi:hypothetical protein